MEFDFETELSKLTREELERLAKSMMTSGVALSFRGKRSAMQIAKKVRPRQTRREPKLHVGSGALKRERGHGQYIESNKDF